MLLRSREPLSARKHWGKLCLNIEAIDGRRRMVTPLVARIRHTSITRIFLTIGGCPKTSEDPAQFKEHPAMPGCSNRTSELDWPKYGIGNQRKHRVARGL